MAAGARQRLSRYSLGKVMAERAAARVSISGRVQGVFFRAETRRAARSLGLSGWVRNLADGSVEALFEGDRGAVDEAIDWCGTGPPAAVVGKVDVEWLAPVGLEGFEVLYR